MRYLVSVNRIAASTSLLAISWLQKVGQFYAMRFRPSQAGKRHFKLKKRPWRASELFRWTIFVLPIDKIFPAY